MNRPMMFWMICLALTAGATAFARGARAGEPVEPAVSAPIAAPSAAAAPDGTASPVALPAPKTSTNAPGAFSRVRIADLMATLVYSLLGLVLGLLGYKVYDWITPFDLRKELEIDQNTSVGIICGAIILGMCIIVAATIRG